MRLALFTAFLLLGSPALAAHVWVGPEAPAGVKAYGDLAAVPLTTLEPGSLVEIAAPVEGPLNLIGLKDLTVRAAGKPFVLSQPIVIEQSENVTVKGFTVENVKGVPGVILRHGARAITVDGVTVRHSGMGIWVTEGAGAGLKLVGNVLEGNETHGIGIDKVNASADERSYIIDNVVRSNGIHGMEINGSFYVVEHNIATDNGRTTPGISGIHVYAMNAEEDAGDHNIIRYNLSFNNHDAREQDGNGIQIDQWCDDNEVAFNAVWDNDGAGINLYDASRNRVYNNTLTGNMRDPGKTHRYRGEMILASDYTRNVDRARDNIIFNNLILASREGVAPIFVEKLAAAGNNHIGPDVTLTRKDPSPFALPLDPLKSGLHPQGLARKGSLPLPEGTADIEGRSPADLREPGFGAYLTPSPRPS